jgi:hypothetical protein
MNLKRCFLLVSRREYEIRGIIIVGKVYDLYAGVAGLS